MLASGSLERPGTRPTDQLAHHFLFGLRTISQIALDGVADQPPLWARADDAECLQLGLDVGGQTDAELRVVLDLLTFSGTGRRSADAPSFLWGF